MFFYMSRQEKAADFVTTSSGGGGIFPSPKKIFENPYKVSGDDEKTFIGPLESFELICVNFISKLKLLHVHVQNFLVELCHKLAVGIHQTYQNSSFFMIRLTFYDQHRSSQTLLFYSK